MIFSLSHTKVLHKYYISNIFVAFEYGFLHNTNMFSLLKEKCTH